MDKDRVKGASKKVGGSGKDAAGKTTGDTELEGKGTAEKTVGKVQNASGKAKDAVCDGVKKRRLRTRSAAARGALS